MIKKVICLVTFMAICTSVWASDIKSLPYKNIKDGSKITVNDSSVWQDKAVRKDPKALKREGNSFYTSDGSLGFETGCDYMFINSGKLIGYSESRMRFYEFNFENGNVSKTELTPDDVSALFGDFRIIKISDFSKTTNSYKFNKKRGEEKIMLLSDNDNDYSNYIFSTNNSKLNRYEINNAVGIRKKGLLQFSKNSVNSKNTEWYVLLVR